MAGGGEFKFAIVVCSGRLAQSGERRLDKPEVTGSSPVPPILGCSWPSHDRARTRLNTGMPTPIDHNEVRRLLAEEDAQLVEVLPAAEFQEEHITGAVNIPLKELQRRAPVELDRGRPVIVYCNDFQ
jgi:hypothetical protein